jgi:hypothetical protein
MSRRAYLGCCLAGGASAVALTVAVTGCGAAACGAGCHRRHPRQRAALGFAAWRCAIEGAAMSGRVYDAQLPLEQRRIKRASRALVNSVGTQTEAADILGMKKDGQRRISELVSSNCPDSLTLFQALELEEEARGAPDWPQVTRAMARHHDFELLPVPALPGVVDWHRGMARSAARRPRWCKRFARRSPTTTRFRPREIRDARHHRGNRGGDRQLANLRAMARAVSTGGRVNDGRGGGKRRRSSR